MSQAAGGGCERAGQLSASASSDARWQRAERVQRRFDPPMLVAALLVIPALAIEEGAPGEPWSTIALGLNWAIWLAFLAEALVMLALVPNRWRWIRSHPLDVAIVVLTPPFMPAALQSLRVFRLLRLLRLLKAVQLSRQLFSVHGLRWAAVVALTTIVAGGAAFAVVERPEQGLSSWDGIWWALTTVTTVGYGDYTPATSGGRIIALLVMAVGIGFVALITAAAAERFVHGGRLLGETHASGDKFNGATVELLARLDSIETSIAELRRSIDGPGATGRPPGRTNGDARCDHESIG